MFSRDGAELVFWSSYDDCSRTIVEESRIVSRISSPSLAIWILNRTY